jgi:hypothetical protein
LTLIRDEAINPGGKFHHSRVGRGLATFDINQLPTYQGISSKSQARYISGILGEGGIIVQPVTRGRVARNVKEITIKVGNPGSIGTFLVFQHYIHRAAPFSLSKYGYPNAIEVIRLGRPYARYGKECRDISIVEAQLEVLVSGSIPAFDGAADVAFLRASQVLACGTLRAGWPLRPFLTSAIPQEQRSQNR